jgi:hypothetical protein
MPTSFLGSESFTITPDVNGALVLTTATGLTGAGGTTTQVQYNNAGALAGAGNVNIDNGDLLIDYNPSPVTPPVDTIKLFGRQVAKRNLLAQVDPQGLDTTLQPFFARNKIGYWDPPGNATTIPGVFGLTALTAVGTATARNVATTNLATRMRRLGYPSNAAGGSLGGAYINLAQFSCGSGANNGSGFMLVERWVESDPAVVAGKRSFAGVSSNIAAPTNVQPSTLTNSIGVGQQSTDATQWYWIQGGSTAQAAVAVGTAVGAPGGNSTTAWELAIYCPNTVANTYYLQLTNVSTGVSATTTMSGTAVQVPQAGTLLAWRHWNTNNTTALATGIDLCSIYIETDS